MGKTIGEGLQVNGIPLAPSTPLKQQAVAATSRHSTRSPSPVRKPWVVADWKHRVEKPKDPACRHDCLQQLQKEHRSEQGAERSKQLAAASSMAQDTIERMLNRCKLIQDTLHVNRPTKHIGSSSQPICRGSGGSSSNGSHRGLQPCTPPLRPASTPHRKQKADNMYLAGRSQLLFEAPGSACSTPCSSSTSAADAVQQQDGQRGAWCGCVDLNPGFTFRPGTPEHAGAVLRHTGQQTVLPSSSNTASPTTNAVHAATQAAPASAVAAAFTPGPCMLTHREHLQLGIQELDASFYFSTRQQQWQQHQQQLQQYKHHADYIPVSWFGMC